MNSRLQQRQYTFLSHRPTHFRVKTETEASQQNRSITKHLTFKNPLVPYQTGEFQTDSFQKISNVTFMGKKTPVEKSLFGEVNIHQKLKFKKQSMQTQYHPLNEHINAGQKKKSQRNVKRYKTSCDTQNISDTQKKSPKNLTMIPIKRTKTSFSEQLSKQHQAMFKIIDEIYKKIDKLIQIGFPDKKISEWIQRYCIQKRNYMTDLLMKSTSKNKFSQSTQTYFFERDPQTVKEKISIKKKIINGVEKPIDIYDLAEFSQYIEEILVNKNKSKVLDLRNSISKKLQQCFFYNRETNQNTFGKKLYAPEILNFMTDLDEFERKNGHFNKISNFNREYFADLGATEKDIRTKVYQLTQLTQSSEKPQRELKKSSTVKIQRKFTRQNTKLIKQAPDEVMEQSDDFEEQNLL